jgi:hypothetical protein
LEAFRAPTSSEIAYAATVKDRVLFPQQELIPKELPAICAPQQIVESHKIRTGKANEGVQP